MEVELYPHLIHGMEDAVLVPVSAQNLMETASEVSGSTGRLRPRWKIISFRGARCSGGGRS